MLEMLTRFMDESSIHTMHVDLEIAMHSAIKRVLPNVKIKACQFHLAQAWFKKIQGLGLTPEYKDRDSDIGNDYVVFFALPVLPAEKIEESFVNVIMEDAPLDERCG
ncbi:nuclear hormone receptor family member nhr-59 [Elysia marginata]|uniref:Nuclear hormone receptor family member nhr-59 n=1 Tax=Elysia marginata TaxID=1093978 RepID=A0AAV4GGV5_9GAST|nr:nuclear hormone receptor family member nhr-59 [Elysia marginata]